MGTSSPESNSSLPSPQPSWHPQAMGAVRRPEAGAAPHKMDSISSSGGRHPLHSAWSWFERHSFSPAWVPARWRNPAFGYVVAVLAQVAAATSTRALLVTVPSFAFPGIVEVLIVALIAIIWGIGPGVVAAVVGLVFEEFWVLPVQAVERALRPGDLVEGVAFLVVGVCIAVAATSTEASRRRAVEERAAARTQAMQQVQDRLDEFIAIAGHDLRSPLTALSGYLELATHAHTELAMKVQAAGLDLAPETARVRDNLDQAQDCAERVIHLTTLLFDQSQARAGQMRLELAPTDLVRLVREQVAAQRLSAPARTVQLDVRVHGPVEVMADTDRLGQVITNYLTNALKYSPASEPVRVCVGSEAGRARVSVTDHGPGLPAGEHERIWERFYRAEGVRVQSGSRGSLGLGLHICKLIIEGHGGAVGVRSQVGQGSTFWFELPLRDVHAAPSGAVVRTTSAAI